MTYSLGTEVMGPSLPRVSLLKYLLSKDIETKKLMKIGKKFDAEKLLLQSMLARKLMAWMLIVMLKARKETEGRWRKEWCWEHNSDQIFYSSTACDTLLSLLVLLLWGPGYKEEEEKMWMIFKELRGTDNKWSSNRVERSKSRWKKRA